MGKSVGPFANQELFAIAGLLADQWHGNFEMTTDTKATETRTFEADVSRLLHMMVHSVYSDRDVFLRS